MSTRSGMGHIPLLWERRHARSLAFVLVALAATLTLFVVGVLNAPSEAYAAVYPIPDSAEVEDSGDLPDRTRSYEWADDLSGDKGDAAEGETIEDDANPLAAGPSANKQASSEGGMGIEILIIAGICIVVVLFVAWLVRLNSNISKMDDSVRSMKRSK